MNCFQSSRRRLSLLALAAALAAAPCSLLLPASAHAQATISTGNIQGTITDTNGGVVAAAKVIITSKATGATFTPSVSSAGTYSSAALAPGDYVVRVEAAGFSTVELPVTVQVGTSTSGSITLQIGSTSTVITVEGSAVSVNTEQAAIQGVVTQQQIERLPINGRNFLDLAQLEPGVQIQDGGVFDPTKKGFSSISFGGGYGRAARIEVDGIDISDENVGTTTQNVPVSAIKEFQVSQSNLDLSSELSASGTVNIVTNAGTNSLHGQGFFYSRNDGTGARIGDRPSQYDRKQYGGNFGGPIWKDKLFAFGSWERTTQDQLSNVSLAGTVFSETSGNFNAPFRDQQMLGRLDWQATKNYRFFYRFSFEQNANTASFVTNTYQPFANVNHTPVHAGGVDFTTGSFTHSFRFGYTKFRNKIADATSESGVFNPAPQVSLIVGNGSVTCTAGGNLFCSGPNILAPQTTYQSNKQFKYDGSRIIHSHILRYGVGVNRILGSAFADFFGNAPVALSTFSDNSDPSNPGTAQVADAGPFPGGRGNPLNYPLKFVILGNGQGCFSETPAFGLKCGGLSDTRLQLYVGDTWKIRPNFTLNLGLRYNRDTGRTDSDLPALDVLNQVEPGLGKPVRQPDRNFGPTAGIAWDPWKNGKTVIRAGAGIYFENNVFNNVLFDRPARLQQGLFNGVKVLCPNGAVRFPDGSLVTTINGKDIATQVCDQPLGDIAQDLGDLQKQFQDAVVAAGPQANGAYFPNALASYPTATGTTLFEPNFQSQRGIQMNLGFQRQLKQGTVFSMDYVRNVGLHIQEFSDVNHDGDSRFLDQAGALSAINLTNAQFGCPAGSVGIDCAIANGATVADYAGNGLTSGTFGAGGGPAGPGAVAFPGKNADFGQVGVIHTDGRSVYNALQMTLRSDLKSPISGIKNLNAQVSYSLSRYISPVLDSNFGSVAPDFRNPAPLAGPSGLDRTHQLSTGIVMDLPFGTRLNMIGHWYTALPQNINFGETGNPEDLLQFDLTGDGVPAAKPLPGSRLGSFGRDIKSGDLNAFLINYDANFGNKLTPAGQALVDAGLFTADQLGALCAVTPSLEGTPGCGPKIALAPSGQVGNDAFFTFDVRLGWSLRPFKNRESFRIEPQVAAFNIFNRQNYNGALTLLNPTLDGGAGSINNTSRFNRAPKLIGLGSGVFALGAPRSMEFGFKVTF